MKTYLNQIHGSFRLYLSLWQSLFLFPAQLFSHQYIMRCSFPSCCLTLCPWPSGFFQALDFDCTSVKVTRAFFYQQIGKGNGCSSFSGFLLIIVFIQELWKLGDSPQSFTYNFLNRLKACTHKYYFKYFKLLLQEIDISNSNKTFQEVQLRNDQTQQFGNRHLN